MRVGIVVDSAAKQQALAQLVAQSGHQLCCQLLIKTDTEALPHPLLDAWLVDVAQDYPDDHHLFEQLFNDSRIPVIVSDSDEYPINSEEYRACLRRTAQRLRRLSSDINLQQATPARDLWILGASTGGPAAVKRFLSRLPDNLGVAFLYVQHIDHQQTAPLNRMMNSAGGYPAMVASPGMVLEPNRLILVTALDRVEILDNRTLAVSHGEGWKGNYAPSIDQMCANAARVYRQHCGLIIFTGMGDDGAASCRLIKQLGGQVWVQTPTECTSDSMPLSALATGCVGYIGSPEALAHTLTQQYR
ncbi:chemotaxis protein CheB [Cellvibrio japonicus]|nr:chemotaxis protein CheB [Cellvibrio japonicus]QEI17584.1 chemotaxis protein CheB [Cellvibrio japonicus]QEI21159.1 chemotaxis protein CheB [Cellvibrio japonicus]